ncbi:hypothetical protein LINGRAHAP2_LOCUS30317 [Linum grandiflorum]
MATDLPFATKESTPSLVPVASSDATTELSSLNPHQIVELIPNCESNSKRQKVEDADYNLPNDGSEKEEQLALEEGDKDKEEKFRLYINRLKETDGFDGEDLRPPTAVWGGVLPMDIDPDNPHKNVKNCVDFVIAEHNSNPAWGMELQLCKILKANRSPCEGSNYYISFSAVDLSSESKAPKEYEARVWHRWDGFKETDIFREKGSSGQVFKRDDGDIVW